MCVYVYVYIYIPNRRNSRYMRQKFTLKATTRAKYFNAFLSTTDRNRKKMNIDIRYPNNTITQL